MTMENYLASFVLYKPQNERNVKTRLYLHNLCHCLLMKFLKLWISSHVVNVKVKLANIFQSADVAHTRPPRVYCTSFSFSN